MNQHVGLGGKRGGNALLQSGSCWFWLALIVLCPVQWLSLANNEWFWEPPKPIGDGPDYENIAYHVWNGDGFLYDNQDAGWREVYETQDSRYAAQLESESRSLRTTGRPPLLPIVISGIYGLAGRNSWAFATVRIFLSTCLALSGALAVMMTVQLSSRWQSGSNSIVSRASVWMGGLGALAFAATNRTLRDYATDFLTEPLALLLMQVFVLLLYKLVSCENQRRWRLAVLAGILLGALVLTRSMFVVWLPALWLLIALMLPLCKLQRFGVASLVVITACLTCSPWWIRNCVVLQAWMPLGTQGTTTLLGGYSDAALHSDGDWQLEPEKQLRAELASRPDFRALASDTEREVFVSREAGRRVRSWFRGHLNDMPMLVSKRIYVHWNPYYGRSLIWKVAILFGVLSLAWHRERAAYWLVGMPAISTVVVAAFYSTGGRFLVPLYGLLFTLSGLGIAFVAVPLLRFLRVQNNDNSAQSCQNDAN